MDDLTHKLGSLRHKLEPSWGRARSQRAFHAIERRRRQRRARTRAFAGMCGLAAALGLGLGWWHVRTPQLGASRVAGERPSRLAPQVADREPASLKQAASPNDVAGARAVLSPNARAAAPAVNAETFGSSAPSTRQARSRALRVPIAGAMLRAGQRGRLADGSIAEVSGEGSGLLVQVNEPDHVALQLASGAARFEVVPNPSRQFTVMADGVQVIVVGTVFSVERAGERVRVAVEHGAVRVQSVVGEARIEAGEARWFDGKKPHTARSHEPSEPSTVLEPAPSEAPVESEPAVAPRVTRATTEPADAEAWMDAAEAARLGHRPEAAAAHLRRVLRDHPGDAVAPLAAFTLGRVLLENLGRPVEAAEAFAQARKLAPDAAIAEDALAREVEAWSKAGRSENASERAQQFIERFPSSRRTRVVKSYGGLSLQ